VGPGIASRGKLSVEEAVAITLDLCKTVATAHKERLLHRDIKSEEFVFASQRLQFAARPGFDDPSEVKNFRSSKVCLSIFEAQSLFGPEPFLRQD
jgi:serine/threonine protein kinase